MARDVLQSFRRQATVFSEALVNRNRISILKMLDDHLKQSGISLRQQLLRSLQQACRITLLTFGRMVEVRMSQYTHQRFRKNVPGPFYTTGDCLACDAPEHEAPDLLAPLTGDNYDTYFVRQPATPDEVERACRAIEVCCVAALRYGAPTQI